MLPSALLAACLAPTAWAQFTRVDYTGRKHSSVAVVDEYLFVHGGEPQGINDTSTFETTILYLKDSWPTSSPTQAPINWQEANGTRTTVRRMLGYRVWGYKLWTVTGSNSLLSWGGFRTSSQTSGTFDAGATLNRNIWSLESDAEGIARWQQQSRPSGDEFTADKKAGQWGPGWGYSVSCAGFGLYLGGLSSPGSGLSGDDAGNASPLGSGRDAGQFTPGLVTYDMASRAFRREEVPASVASGAMAGGQAVCIPHLGKKGLVAFMGGYSAPDFTELRSLKTGGGSTAVTFDHLIFYDPVDRKWATQKATGDIPEARSSFCAVGVKGKGDNFEVFVSGGDLSPDQGKDTATIYMLSIPAMNWWRISQLGTPISGHACDVIGKRHMVQVGGSPPPRRNGETSTPAGSGVTLFDMTNLKSVSQFDPAAADYETPSLAQTWYADANNLKGVEWTDAATQALLTGKSNNGTQDGQGQGQNGSGSDGPSAAIIAGAVVGALVVIAIVALGIFCLLRRRRQRRAEQDGLLSGNEAAAAAAYSDNAGVGVGLKKAELDAAGPVKAEMDATSAVASPELDGATLARSELDSRMTTPVVSSIAPSELGSWPRHQVAELYGSPIPEMDATPAAVRGEQPGDGQKAIIDK
ncbi:hypothetical protein M0657_005595 [Pyricularia oryzae]|uniref:receptor protein-tyrosine kinase n=2 Tax=Pyricularia oryzae TaxID=318829 RepID=A0AA97PNX0_PYRO3|nr:hypothetical protein OOU_Y34scaffold00284g2 [Pyricularia oryzae Y34]KAI7911973.1 hypothetical protein M9X92_010266 [Pyricularia oryzae]KAI7922468.1 hypothetical protein M0657_005595 [Pyricularia oryzae]